MAERMERTECTERMERIEVDLLGEKAVPTDAYYGVQTQRAIENFHISGKKIQDVDRKSVV